MFLLPAVTHHVDGRCECKNTICGENTLEKGISVKRGGVTHLDISDVNEDITVVFDHATI